MKFLSLCLVLTTIDSIIAGEGIIYLVSKLWFTKYNYLTLAPKLITAKTAVFSQPEGTKFRIFCSIQKGTTPLVFKWSKNGHKLDVKSNPNYKVETSDELSILSIASVERSDSANYSCFVSNTYGTDSQTVVLNVKGIQHKSHTNTNENIISYWPPVPPTWLKEPQDIRVKAGDDVVVECIADGLPKPTVKWISSKGMLYFVHKLLVKLMILINYRKGDRRGSPKFVKLQDWQ